jgi:hypothetical protein
VQSVSRLLLALNLAAAYAAAATFYVSTQGADSNPGSSSAPFRTLARAVAVAGPGDTVIVSDGIYGHEDTITGGDGSQIEAAPVVLRRSGYPNAWITIKAENKWGAVLDCEMLCDAYIDLKDASYIVIQDFVVTRGYREGIHSNGAAHDIALRGNRIEYIANRSSSTTFGMDGMYTSPNCYNFIIDGNVFHDIGRNDATNLDHGLYLRGSYFTVTNNIFYNIPHGWSIQAADGLNNVLIANNTFAFQNNPGPPGGQIMLWNTQSNIVIRNNIFYQPRNSAIVRNRSSVSACYIDHNLVSGANQVITDPTGCAVWSTLSGDPQFVNSSLTPFDFHLQASSPAIGAGAAVTGLITDFDGNTRSSDTPPDIGALAAGSGSPLPAASISNDKSGGVTDPLPSQRLGRRTLKNQLRSTPH